MNTKLIEELWSENPDIYKILKESEDLEEARR